MFVFHRKPREEAVLISISEKVQTANGESEEKSVIFLAAFHLHVTADILVTASKIVKYMCPSHTNKPVTSY